MSFRSGQPYSQVPSQEGAVVTVEATPADLLVIERAHQSDHDGGYGLASALCDYRRQNSEWTVNEWDEVLVGWERDGSARFWDLRFLVRRMCMKRGLTRSREEDKEGIFLGFLSSLRALRGFA